MASTMALQFCSRRPPSFTSTPRSSSLSDHITQNLHKQINRRKLATTAAAASAFLLQELFFTSNTASSFDLRVTVPDQTPAEANTVVKSHARDLLEIKSLIDSKSWRELQLALRESSPYLKQDLYTLIQAKSGSQRPQLRKLYSHLFNNVSNLDYAARDRDEVRVQEYYDNIVTTLNEIFARI
ncbi:psbQ-like protein 3, chloroplastic [Typha angustifolia]|uniref:psbQ-like protein 3, chloroplastic n=1 Tax=Typha angustifolia TaxID=59011 RepID=UPI003C2DE6E8